jgi:hypothetical protein
VLRFGCKEEDHSTRLSHSLKVIESNHAAVVQLNLTSGSRLKSNSRNCLITPLQLLVDLLYISMLRLIRPGLLGPGSLGLWVDLIA